MTSRSTPASDGEDTTRPRRRLGIIQQSILDRNPEALLDHLLSRTKKLPNGCAIWQGATREEYGFVGRAETLHLVHRLVAWAKLGMPADIRDMDNIGHTCGRSLCIAVDHLEPVASWGNALEMRVRRALHDRIEALENALRPHDPDNWLLHLPPLDGGDLPVLSRTLASPREKLRRLERQNEIQQKKKETRARRFRQVMQVRADKANGSTEKDALERAGLSRRVFQDWARRLDRYLAEGGNAE